MATTTKKVEFGPSEVFLQKPDGTLEPLVGDVHTADIELEEKGSWFESTSTHNLEFSCEVSVSQESRDALFRIARQAVLDDLVNYVRKSRAYGHRRGHWEMAKEQFDYASAISHRLHGMNLTRYLRSWCRYPARGIRVYLPSGYRVWRK